MHQTPKGNQWYFGMKAHVGVDAQRGLFHHVVGTAANVSDITQTRSPLHGQEKHVHGDAAIWGPMIRSESQSFADTERLLAIKRGKIKAMTGKCCRAIPAPG